MLRVPTISFDGSRSAITISLTKLPVKPRMITMEIIWATLTMRKVALKGAAP
jgi:hypothetical protein